MAIDGFDFDGESTPVLRPAALAGHVAGGPLPVTDEAPEWLLHAYGELGVKELEGTSLNNPRIMEYFKATTLGTSVQNDETAWCSAFACWCVERSGYTSPHRANARSWMGWGFPMPKPSIGAITVFWRNSPQSAMGHVAFYMGERSGSIWVLGGNQHNAVSIALYPQARLLGYRWPNRID